MYIKPWLENGCTFVKSPNLFRCKEGTLYYKASRDILKRFVFTTYVPTGSCVLCCAWSVVTRNSLTPIYQFVFHQQKWFCLFVMSWWLIKCEHYLCHQCKVFVIVKTQLFFTYFLGCFPWNLQQKDELHKMWMEISCNFIKSETKLPWRWRLG